MEEQTYLNFNDIIKELENISKESFYVDVWVPSQKKSFKIKDLNTKQQKIILDSILSDNNENTFLKVFYDILKDNWLDDVFVFDNLTAIDKVSIAFCIRNNISNTLKFDFSEDGSLIKDIDLSQIVNGFKTFEHPENKKLKFDINSSSLEIEFQVPTIKQEIAYESYIIQLLKEKKESEEIKNIMVSSFATEFSIYLKEVILNNENFNFSALTIPEKLQIIEYFPVSIIDKIFNEILTVKNIVKSICTVKYENYSKNVEINGLLFL